MTYPHTEREPGDEHNEPAAARQAPPDPAADLQTYAVDDQASPMPGAALPPDAMSIWNRVATPPPHALKTITGGPLKGFTDVNPQWRRQALTQLFGPIGFGWRSAIMSKWTQQLPTGEVACFVSMNLFYRLPDGNWSEPIEGSGGSKLVTMDGDGKLRLSDEGWKMATTDAFSVCCAQLGIAADVYMGRMDTKYEQPGAAAQAPARGAAPQELAPGKKFAGFDGAVIVPEIAELPDAAVACDCGRAAKKFQSGPKSKNPGRWFYTCSRDRNDANRCNFFQWA